MSRTVHAFYMAHRTLEMVWKAASCSCYVIPQASRLAEKRHSTICSSCSCLTAISFLFLDNSIPLGGETRFSTGVLAEGRNYRLPNISPSAPSTHADETENLASFFFNGPLSFSFILLSW